MPLKREKNWELEHKRKAVKKKSCHDIRYDGFIGSKPDMNKLTSPWDPPEARAAAAASAAAAALSAAALSDDFFFHGQLRRSI